MTFQDFKFKDNLQKAIDEAGFKEPSPIQIDAIPHILLGKDIVGQAHTGTGKTAAFGLPVLNQLTGKNAEAVVIVPTRELAMQVSDELFKFGNCLWWASLRKTTKINRNSKCYSSNSWKIFRFIKKWTYKN